MYFIPSPTAFSTVPDFGSAANASGYHLDFISTTQMFLNPGYARAHTNDFAISYPGNQPGLAPYILLDTTVVGAGGCYPKAMANVTMANDTVFGIYVIGKSSGTTNGSLDNAVNVSAVIATGDNFLPPGYDVYRRVGLCYVDSATKLLIKWIQAGNGSEKQYLLQDYVSAVTAGNAIVDTDLDLSAGDGVILPGHSNYAQLSVAFLPSAAGEFVVIQPTVLNATSFPPVTLVAPSTTVITWTTEIVCGILGSVFEQGNAAIKYKVSNAGSSVSIAVGGFTDSLGNDFF